MASSKPSAPASGQGPHTITIADSDEEQPSRQVTDELSVADLDVPAYNNPGAPKQRQPGEGWRHVLHEFLHHPTAHIDRILYQDNRCMVIYDAYPKARMHVLLLPKPDFLSVQRVADIQTCMLPQVRILHQIAHRVGAALHRQQSSIGFLCGYHAEPSLTPLHIHIISGDLCSPCLKNKKHWTSFATGFLVGISEVETALEDDDRDKNPLDREVSRLIAQRKQALGSSLLCHRCGHPAMSMPAMKAHAEGCTEPLRGDAVLKLS